MHVHRAAKLHCDKNRWNACIGREIVVGMVTIDLVTNFGRESVKIEHLLQKSRVTTSTGRTILVLTMANAEKGVTQKKIVEVLSLSKESVTKLLQRLADAGVLVKQRTVSDARCWQIITTDSGRELVSEVRSVLRARRGSIKHQELPW